MDSCSIWMQLPSKLFKIKTYFKGSSSLEQSSMKRTEKFILLKIKTIFCFSQIYDFAVYPFCSNRLNCSFTRFFIANSDVSCAIYKSIAIECKLQQSFSPDYYLSLVVGWENSGFNSKITFCGCGERETEKRERGGEESRFWKTRGSWISNFVGQYPRAPWMILR